MEGQLIGTLNRVICQVAIGSDHEEDEANARLIAAAPDGLEAAKVVLEWWDVTPCRPQGDEPRGITRLRAFVALADGKRP